MWAKRIAVSNSHLFISFTSGKAFPLIWMVAFFLKILPEHLYLLAGRLPSVFFGAITIIATYRLTYLWFKSKRVALLAALIAILTPFLLFHDRMLLYDSQLAAMMTMGAYLACRTARTRQLRDALLWGLFLGFAFLSKSPAILYLGITPLVFLVQTRPLLTRGTVFLLLCAVLTCQIVANINIVSTGYFEYIRKSLDYTPGAKLASPAFGALFTPNMELSSRWLSSYLTPPLFLFSLLGLIVLVVKRPKIGTSLFLLGILPILAFSLAARIYFPRYIVFVAPYFVISAAYLICGVVRKSKVMALSIGLLLLLLPLQFTYGLLFNPPTAAFPEEDRWQYVTGFPSGYGFEPIFKYLHNESQDKTICLIIEGSYSHYPNAFWLEFWHNRNIYIEERWPLTTQDIKDNHCFTPRGLALQPIMLRSLPLEPIEKTYYIVWDDEKTGLKDATRLKGLTSVIEGLKPEGSNSVYLGETTIIKSNNQ